MSTCKVTDKVLKIFVFFFVVLFCFPSLVRIFLAALFGAVASYSRDSIIFVALSGG